MYHPLLNATAIDVLPERYLQNSGQIFAVFNTQDSGNISYGVQVANTRYFVKPPAIRQTQSLTCPIRNA